MSPQCIVIGASAGGLEPLREVVAQLPAGFSGSRFRGHACGCESHELSARYLEQNGSTPWLASQG